MKHALLGIFCCFSFAACGQSTSDPGKPASHSGAAGVDAGSGGAGSGGDRAGSSGADAGAAGALAGGALNAGGAAHAAGGAVNAGGAAHVAGAAGAAAAPFACGSVTCGVSQYCVNPCCGGAPPQCIMKPDGGVCPVGTHAGCILGGGQCSKFNDCCQYDPCTPPPPYCADQLPVGCGFLEGRSCRMQCA